MATASPNPKTKTFAGSVANDQAIAGFCAGAVSTIVLHPFDVIKIRFQMDERSYRRNARNLTPESSLWRRIWNVQTIVMWRQIAKEEGTMRGLYRGLSANFAGSALSWGLYFWCYQKLKDSMKTEGQQRLSPANHLIASAEAGAFTSCFTNPIWLIKTRMCAQRATDVGAYKSLTDGLVQTWKGEGIRGLYRGLIPALFGASHGAIQFMAYEEMKLRWTSLSKKREAQNLGTMEYIVMASASKVVAALCTYPYQVVKARLQNERSISNSDYNGVISTISRIYRREGLAAFYKGLGTNLLRVLPGTAITFSVYESLSKLFRT
ncbi:mitochondrial carrier domain-containing protein [Cladochytrium replicatum]|nr:mitochondrial carrier domain-containing protein [Cladochytrium replicatum]